MKRNYVKMCSGNERIFFCESKRMVSTPQYHIPEICKDRENRMTVYRAIQAETRAVSCMLVPLPVGVSVRTIICQHRGPEFGVSKRLLYVESKDPADQPT